MKLKCSILFVFVANLCLSKAANNKMQILDSIAGDSYDSRVPPHGPGEDGDGPVNVKLNVYVRSISNLDDVGMNYKVQLTVRQEWNDDRLVYDDTDGKIKHLVVNDLHKIWIPDLFFGNEISARFHDVMTPNVLLRIYPNGNVLLSVRISLTLFCTMHLKNFPLDRQACSIVILSYGHTTDELVLLWKEIDPVQITKSLNLLTEFTLVKYLTAYCNSRTKTGEYSCLRIDFLLKREAHTYMLLVYIPNTMLVVVAWIAFWIPQKAGLVRSVVAVGSLLALFLHIALLNGLTLPLVPYTKAIDVWTGVCLTFVFAAFVEFVLVHCLWVKKQRHDCSSDFEMKQLVAAENAARVPTQSNVLVNYWKRSDWSHRIDAFCRVFYPVCFGVFNICYWLTYLSDDD